MSRISDALKRAGAPDVAAGLDALPTAVVVPAPSPVPDAELRPAPDPSWLDPAAGGATAPGDNGGQAAMERPVESLFGAIAETADEKLIANPELSPVAVEQYRRLAAILHHAQEERGIRRVLVSSALASEGKTLTATNLALTLSQSYGRRVLLVDADLRRPGIGFVFGLPNGSGLGEVLHSPAPQKLPIVQVSARLSVLPAGHPTSDPMAGLTSARMATILEEAGQAFDWVVVDSPPVGILPDARLLATMVDGTLLVIKAGLTPCAAVQLAADSLGRERILGVVLNRVDHSVAGPGEYQYYSYYGQAPRDARPRGLLARLLRRR